MALTERKTMFNEIRNIFKPPPQQAQSTDTRMEIKRHDPDYERKKNDKRKKTAQELFDEADGATVSVDALHIFLENFLKSQKAAAGEGFASAAAAAPQESIDLSEPAGKKEQDQSDRPNGMAAHAAQAYQSMAEKTHEPERSHILANASLDKGPEIALSGGDVRTIHRLLQDLKALEARDIHYLRIEKGENFLQSIVAAVAKLR